MKTIYVYFASPSGRMIMYLSTVKTIGPKLFEVTTADELRFLAHDGMAEAVDFSSSSFPRKATPIELANGKLFDNYVRLINAHR
jgi:hypothetical protein